MTESEQHSPEAPTENLEHSLPLTSWLALSQGFSYIFWSIPLAILLATGRLYVAVLDYLALPTFLVPVFIFLRGFIILRRVRDLTPDWNRILLKAIGVGLLLLYFAPFSFWWQRQPQVDYLMANVFALSLASSWAFWLANRLTEELAKYLSNKTLRVEARLSAVIVLVLMFAPLATFAYVAIFSAIQYDIPLYQAAEVLEHARRIRWMFTLMLSPIALTAMLLWKAKTIATAQIYPRLSR